MGSEDRQEWNRATAVVLAGPGPVFSFSCSLHTGRASAAESRPVFRHESIATGFFPAGEFAPKIKKYSGTGN